MASSRSNDLQAKPDALPREAVRPVAAWSIDGPVAKQASGGPSERDRMPAVIIRLDHPAAGIHPAPKIGCVGAASAGWPICLLGLVLDPAAERAMGGHVDGIAPTDRWVRGDDVVAVYEPQDPRSLRATAMWRRWPTGSPAVRAWELIVSCQTSLLESDATVLVRTLPAASEIDPIGANAALARTPSGPSVLVAAHPLDDRRLTIRPSSAPASDGGSRGGEPAAIECWLFPSVVEKGVLLRGRVLAAVGPREHDDEWSASLLDRFAASPPPLTT